MSNSALAVVLEARQARVLAEDVGRPTDRRRPRPSRAGPPTCDRIHQSGRASPGGRQERALARDAPLGVGDGAVLLAPGRRRQPHVRQVRRVVAGDVLRDDQQLEPRSASRTWSARGRLTAGLVPITHSALMSPAAIASNICTALWPSPSTRFGAFQKRRTRSRSGAEKPMWAASMLASPPTSRPPMALGWPVSDSGPAPGLPMRPVARWQLMMALTLSVPCADWLTPCE